MKRNIYIIVLIILISICFTIPVYAVSSQDDNRYLQGVSSDTPVGVLISDFDLGYNEVGVYKNDIQKGNMDVVATGDTVKVVSNGETSQGTVGVLGDIDGDGNIDDNDRQALKSSILKNTTLSGAYKTAADLNDNDIITGSDYAMLRLHQLGKKQIDNSTELIFNPGFRKFYIAFNLNYHNANQNISPQTISEGNVISKPSDPTRSEYDFDGWYTDEFLTYKFDFTTKPDRDMVLYAKWTTDDPDLQLLNYAYHMCRITYDEVDNANSITKNITLPTGIDVDFDNTDDVEVTWTSNNEQILSDDGAVTRPSVSAEVTLTAQLSSNNRTISKEFELKVIRKLDIDVSTIQDHSTVESLASLNNNITPIVELDENNNVARLDGVFSDITVECGEDALVALNSVKSLLGISNPQDELTLFKSNELMGTKSFVFKQSYNNLEVYGRMISVIIDEGGKPNYINSSYLPNINISTTPQISEQDAIDSVKQNWGTVTDYKVTGQSIYSLDVFNSNPSLAYVVLASGEHQESGNYIIYDVFVDAINGDVLFSYSNIKNYKSVKAEGYDEFEVKRKFDVIEVEEGIDTYYQMYDEKRNICIGAYDGIFIEWLQKFNCDKIEEIKSATNQWDNKSSVSAYVNLRQIYDWWADECRFGRKSFDGDGQQIIGLVDVNGDFDNAFHYRNVIAFRPKLFRDYTTAAYIDVAAHEFTHGVASDIGSVTGNGESGSIEEAYCDMFACFIDKDWMVSPLRCISNPHDTGHPKKYKGTNWIEIIPITSIPYTSDPIGVHPSKDYIHDNSTVVSHAAYLMNDKGMDYETLARLWFYSLNLKYDANSKFVDVRKNVLKAGYHLGLSFHEMQIICDSFDEVGITGDIPLNYFGGDMSDNETEIEYKILEINKYGKRVSAKNAIVSFENPSNVVFGSNTGDEGEVVFSVQYGNSYNLTVEKEGYKKISKTITISDSTRIKNEIILESLPEKNPHVDAVAKIKNSRTKVYDILIPTREYSIDLDGDGTNEKFSFDIFGTDEYTLDTLELSDIAYEYMKDKNIDDIFTNSQEFFENTPRDLFYTNNIVLSELNNGERISIEGAKYEPYMLLSDIDSTDGYFDIILSGFIYDSNPGSYILRYNNGVFENLGWVNGGPGYNLTVDGSGIVTVVEYYESESDNPPQQVKYKVVDNKLVEIERKLYEEQGRIIQATGTVVHTTLTNDITFYFDLNEDGTDEKVEIYDNSSGELTVTVNDSLSYSTPASNLQGDILICDIDNNVPGLQIVISDQGPSADYSALFLEYDGTSLNNMCYEDNYEKTGVRDNPYNTLKIDGSGIMTGTERTWFPYTWEKPVEYQAVNNKVVEIEKEHYDMNVQGTMLTELDLYESPTSNTVVKKLSVGEKVTLLYGDAKSWIYIEGENGSRGYCKVSDEKIDGKYSYEVFYGLPSYD